MFEVNRTYANRKGKYTVTELHPPKMTVRYEDGTVADLNMEIQARIWENIQGEEETRAAARTARQSRSALDSNFYIKSLSMEVEEDLSVPGWRERITVVPPRGPQLKQGDRILYYAVEDRVFFALGTVTGPALDSVPKGYFYSDAEAEGRQFYPIDLDEQATSLDAAVPLDNAELESVPDFRRQIQKPDTYLSISEDDFELLAEMLTEVTEEEDEDFDEEEDDEEDYED